MIRFAVLLALLAAPALAFEPDLPAGARALSDRVSEAGYDLPTGPWTAEGMETLRITGTILRRTWRIEEGLTTQQIVEPLVEQARAAGFDPVFACQDRDCGGFDFRFAIDVVPGPDMFVDLGDFRYVSAVNGAGDGLGLLVSAGRGGAWLQVAEVTRAAPTAPADLARALVETGRLVLEDADAAPLPALEVLAEVLAQHPDARLAIVAHSGGPAEAEQSEGLAGAEALRDRLIADHGVDPGRIEAHWLGPYAPRAAPLDPAGRALNRRIEAVLLPAGE